jgi:drug/metabolite transporter (DMT)-like permease
LLVLFGAFLWGTLVVVTKGASHLDPLTVAVMRCAMAALGCFAWFGFRNPRLLRVGPGSRAMPLFCLFLYGGATCAFMYAGFTIALRTLSVAACEVIFYTFPLFTTFLGIFVLRERPSAAQVFACVLIVSGVFLMTSLSGPGGSAPRAALPLAGVAGAALSMLGMTIQSLVGRGNAKKGWLPVETLFSYAHLFGLFWIVLCKSVFSGWGDLPRISAASWLLLAYMGFITTLLGYGAYNLGLRYVSAATASMLASFEMVTAVVLDAAVLKTVPTRGEIVGCLVILAALALGTRGAGSSGAGSGNAASSGAASDGAGQKTPA